MKTEQEPKEAFDWALVDIVQNSPYSKYDTVIALALGQFLIEGRKSTFSDALYYAESHPDTKAVWSALEDLETNGVTEEVY